MKRLLYFVAASLFCVGPAFGQEGQAGSADLPQVRGIGATNSNYYLDRKTAARLAIQQRAAFKAAQRQQRIEAFKWAGYSLQRPPAGHLPIMGVSSPWLSPVIYYQYPGVFFPRTASLAR